jgi:hypothetical protein
VADKAAFIMDVTVPDGEPRSQPSFVKTWRLQNDGQTTWSTAYSLVFVSGSLMSAQAEIAMPQEVIPGDTVDISVELLAPADKGSYQSLWKLRNDNGQAFGVGELGTDPIWAIIEVVAGAVRLHRPLLRGGGDRHSTCASTRRHSPAPAQDLRVHGGIHPEQR